MAKEAQTPGPLILLIEDEPQLRRFLRNTLTTRGFRLVEAETGEQGLMHATGHNPDLILLDLGLPDMDGIEVMKRLREWSSVPVIVVSARGQEDDKIRALDLGADDYLTKPFSAGELLARMRVAMRHAASRTKDAPEAIFETSGLKVDLAKRQVFVRGEEVHLTPIEYKLLALLVKHAGMVVTQQQVLREVWGPTQTDQTHYLRVYMGHLRRKIEADPARPKLLITETGVGYRLRESE
jgi:two-component system KDP operon response regulator KdpE